MHTYYTLVHNNLTLYIGTTFDGISFEFRRQHYQQKDDALRYFWQKLRDPSFSRFVSIHSCHGLHMTKDRRHIMDGHSRTMLLQFG